MSGGMLQAQAQMARMAVAGPSFDCSLPKECLSSEVVLDAEENEEGDFSKTENPKTAPPPNGSPCNQDP